MNRDPTDRHDYGILVGWSHATFTDKIDLKLQTVQSSRQLKSEDLDTQHIVMTASQALLLANYLFQITGQAPVKKPGILTRLLGG
ncbi:MAG: hypothetical protein ACK44O_14785 [Novosphingobium sp.]|jgi:hypothetical protein|uniref:hypothetical protein n=1 Tax=Novosphingobium sp. TaxID=1874826 RepID=UPI00391BB467|nr:hypothetical protein [Novosphingobium sp.]